MERSTVSDAHVRFGRAGVEDVECEVPAMVKVRAIDVLPYRFGIWCTVGGWPQPFANEIVGSRWSEDGKKIWFMLETHNFQEADPDELMELVPIDMKMSPDALRMADANRATPANRPAPKLDPAQVEREACAELAYKFLRATHAHVGTAADLRDAILARGKRQ